MWSRAVLSYSSKVRREWLVSFLRETPVEITLDLVANDYYVPHEVATSGGEISYVQQSGRCVSKLTSVNFGLH